MTDSPDPRDSPGPVVNDEHTGPTGAGRRSRPVIAFLATGLVLVLGAGSLTGLRLFGVWGPGPGSTAGPAATPGPTATAAESPFAGTPAADFAEGAAGIVLPEAEPVGDFAAEQVADALAQVRQALIATRLDPTMLVHHNPEEFVELLAPAQRSAVRETMGSATFATFATQIAGDATLAAAAPRVAGQVSYRAATAELDLPVLEVVTRFAWVYAFETERGEPGPGIAVVRDELVWQYLQADAFLEPSRGLRLAEAAGGAWAVDCEAYDRGLILPEDTADPGKAPDVAFDPQRSIKPLTDC